VTVIIPVFNDQRVRIAVESVAMQHVDFGIELLVVNDGSTDSTPEVLGVLQEEFAALRIISNSTNLGKGASFRRAYQEANGKYIHVLDADDFFTDRKKLQDQFDELENNPTIFAVATNTLISYTNGKVGLLNKSKEVADYSYHQFINNEFYHHTSAYLFRKTNLEIPIEFDTVRGLRGDTACMYFHGYHSGLGVRFLPKVGSVYSVHGEGLWSSLTSNEQSDQILETFLAIRDFVIATPDSFEYQTLTRKVKELRLTVTNDSVDSPDGEDRASFLQTCLNALAQETKYLDCPETHNAANHSMRSDVIESYLDALGSVFTIEAGLAQHQALRPND